MRKLFAILVFAFLLFSPNISKSNIVEELTKLNNLYKEGAINKEEFSKAKSILLKSKQSNETNEVNTKKKVKKKIKKEETKSNKKISKKKLKQEDIKPFEDLTNTYASLQDVEEFGSFERITIHQKECSIRKSTKIFHQKQTSQ